MTLMARCAHASAQHLRQLNNFNGVMSVLAGLSTASVSRLKYTWGEVSPKFIKVHCSLVFQCAHRE